MGGDCVLGVISFTSFAFRVGMFKGDLELCIFRLLYG